MFRRHLISIIAILLVAWPGAAQADWILYLSGHLGMSWGTTSLAGASDQLPAGSQTFAGTFADSSPLIAGAFGVAIPLNETTAWELPYDLRLPTWPLRFEVEATGLRSFEGMTDGPGNFVVFGATDTWSVMFDLWQDVPMAGLGRPVAWVLGGRAPRWITRTLDQMHVYGGAGIGVAGVSMDFTDNEHIARAEETQFAWQAGAGFVYALTRAVMLDLGYRYFDYGSLDTRFYQKVTLVDHGPFQMMQTSHEFRGGLRVNFWGFQPWR